MTDEDNKNKEIAKDSEESPKTVSLVDEARAIRDEIKKEREALQVENKKKETLQAEELLGSSAGGHVEAPKVSPEELKKAGAKEFFKGTQLEADIDKL